MSETSVKDIPLRVVSVRAHAHRAPLLRPFITAQRSTASVDYVVVDCEVESPSGERVVGQGSAAETVAVTGEDCASILRCVRSALSPALTGERGSIHQLDARAAAAAGTGASSASAAVSVALFDAWSRLTNQPLAAVLASRGGWPEPERAMVNDMTISLQAPDTMAEEARAAAAQGEQILKIKLGSDPEEDRQRLQAVVDAAPGVRLRLDANQGWSADDAITIIRRFDADGLPIDLIEQPCPADDLDGMARVTAATQIPIMADESIWTAADAQRVIDARAADLLNIKLAKSGSISEAIAIADAAHTAGVPCMVGAMMEPRISITAAAHLACAHPAITMIDLDSPQWFAEQVPTGGYTVTNGVLNLAGGPGLGLNPLSPREQPLDDHP